MNPVVNAVQRRALRMDVFVRVALFLLLGGVPVSLFAADGPPLGDLAHLEPGLKGRSGILFYQGFASPNWIKSWAPDWGPQPLDHGAVVDAPGAPGGKALRVTYPAGEIGGPSGYQFLSHFPKLGFPAMREAYLRYYLRFEPGFDFVKGGKLPGLGGGQANTGGHAPNGCDGWTARMMWRPDGRIVQYVYHPGQKGIYGDDLDWAVDGKPVYFEPGRWACVETRVKLNDPGSNNGEIQSWLDGREALHAKGLRFRDVPELKLDVFFFSTFFGGGDLSWAAHKDEIADFSGFVLGRGPIGVATKQSF